MNLEETKEFVRKQCIRAEFIEHAQIDATTSANAAFANNEDPSKIIKVLCFVDGENKCFAIIQGNKRVDSKKLGLKKSRLARAEELKLWFNAEPGAIPPIGLPEEIPKLVDVGVMQQEYVIGSGGSKFVGLKLSPRDISNQANLAIKEIS